MAKTLTRWYKGSEYEYEFLGITDEKLCYHIVPQQYPLPIGIKHVITIPLRKGA